MDENPPSPRGANALLCTEMPGLTMEECSGAFRECGRMLDKHAAELDRILEDRLRRRHATG
jgi:hypothetical protein